MATKRSIAPGDDPNPAKEDLVTYGQKGLKRGIPKNEQNRAPILTPPANQPSPGIAPGDEPPAPISVVPPRFRGDQAAFEEWARTHPQRYGERVQIQTGEKYIDPSTVQAGAPGEVPEPEPKPGPRTAGGRTTGPGGGPKPPLEPTPGSTSGPASTPNPNELQRIYDRMPDAGGRDPSSHEAWWTAHGWELKPNGRWVKTAGAAPTGAQEPFEWSDPRLRQAWQEARSNGDFANMLDTPNPNPGNTFGESPVGQAIYDRWLASHPNAEIREAFNKLDPDMPYLEQRGLQKAVHDSLKAFKADPANYTPEVWQQAQNNAGTSTGTGSTVLEQAARMARRYGWDVNQTLDQVLAAGNFDAATGGMGSSPGPHTWNPATFGKPGYVSDPSVISWWNSKGPEFWQKMAEQALIAKGAHEDNGSWYLTSPEGTRLTIGQAELRLRRAEEQLAKLQAEPTAQPGAAPPTAGVYMNVNPAVPFSHEELLAEVL